MPGRSAKPPREVVLIDPKPTFDLSPHLSMQFMEPLGATDASVEAGWDFMRNCWRKDFVDVTRQLAPRLIRWPGGCFSSYYRWKEGVGPRARRVPMVNICWGGMETNQVGTHEFMDFCRQVRAEALIAVNFEADGRKSWARPPCGGIRSAGPKEAAEWVDYCNNPANVQRRRNGARRPFGVRLWQIGNETSYDPNGYDCLTAARRTVAFAKAMRRADPDIELIGWGDSGWARTMLEVAGEHIQYLAFHPPFSPRVADSPLDGEAYRSQPVRAWKHLMDGCETVDAKIRQIREEVAGRDVKLAATEGHFYLSPRNQSPLLRTWAAGVANARVLNVYARHGDMLKIATAADFCGNRWTTSAVMIQNPGWLSYLMPVGRVTALFGSHVGRKAVGVAATPRGLDVTASRSGRRICLHVVNPSMCHSVRARLRVEGMRIASGRGFEIADDPWRQIHETEPDLFSPRQRPVPRSCTWTFPAASVTAIELLAEPTGRSKA